MPVANAEETKSAPEPTRKKKKFHGGLSLVLLAMVIVFLFIAMNLSGSNVRLAGETFDVLVADNDATRQQGLSGIAGLESDKGMLFLFDNPSADCFWMKDMNFAIDILWFDAGKKLIHQERDVSPDSYPDKFCPDKQAHYVLEVLAGTSERLNLQKGAKLEINL